MMVVKIMVIVELGTCKYDIYIYIYMLEGHDVHKPC